MKLTLIVNYTLNALWGHHSEKSVFQCKHKLKQTPDIIVVHITSNQYNVKPALLIDKAALFFNSSTNFLDLLSIQIATGRRSINFKAPPMQRAITNAGAPTSSSLIDRSATTRDAGDLKLCAK